MASIRLAISGLLTTATALGLAPAAEAHIALTGPTVRYEDAENPINNPQKDGPCGMVGGERTNRVCVYRPGSTIEVTWDETIEHPGHFRVSFDDDGVDAFQNPVDDNPLPAELGRLADRVVDTGDPVDRAYSINIELPDIECDNCTLQLIQVMDDTPPYIEADLYYQCADIVLSSTLPEGCTEGPLPDPDDPDEGDDGDDTGGPGQDAGIGVEDGEDTFSGAQGGCNAGGASGGTTGIMILLGAIFLVTRRRRQS